MSLLEVEGLRVRLRGADGPISIVHGVDYRIEQGEVFGVAGESGSGKTISMLALLGLLPEGANVEGSVRAENPRPGDRLVPEARAQRVSDDVQPFGPSARRRDAFATARFRA